MYLKQLICIEFFFWCEFAKPGNENKRLQDVYIQMQKYVIFFFEKYCMCFCGGRQRFYAKKSPKRENVFCGKLYDVNVSMCL